MIHSGSRDNPPQPAAPVQEAFAWVELKPAGRGERKAQQSAPRTKSAARANPPRRNLAAEAWDDVYADPIDGIPFEAGEQVIQCVCGTAYRLPTVAWLRELLRGECILCHAELHHTPRTLSRQRCFDAATFASAHSQAGQVWEMRPATSSSRASSESGPR